MEKEILNMVNEITQRNIIESDSLPRLDLYVDQVTNLIEDNLISIKENHITKSMINNYCKNKVVPPSANKKYNLNHLLMFITIYNTKSILSIQDIGKIFASIEEDTLDYYDFTNKLIKEFNLNFEDLVEKNLASIDEANLFDDDKVKAAVLATQLAIEANNKKMLSEMIIERYL